MILKDPWRHILFPLRLFNYNLRGSGLNVTQKPYNSLVMHKFFLYKIAHMWNKLSAITKSSTTLAQFHSRWKGFGVSREPVCETYFLTKFLT